MSEITKKMLRRFWEHNIHPITGWHSFRKNIGEVKPTNERPEFVKLQNSRFNSTKY